MVMMFSDPRAREQLLGEGKVYTFRKMARTKSGLRKTVGRDWAAERRGGSKIADITVAPVMKVMPENLREALTPLAEWSGFVDVDKWIEAIERLNRGRAPEGWLYRVTLREADHR